MELQIGEKLFTVNSIDKSEYLQALDDLENTVTIPYRSNAIEWHMVIDYLNSEEVHLLGNTYIFWEICDYMGIQWCFDDLVNEEERLLQERNRFIRTMSRNDVDVDDFPQTEEYREKLVTYCQYNKIAKFNQEYGIFYTDKPKFNIKLQKKGWFNTIRQLLEQQSGGILGPTFPWNDVIIYGEFFYHALGFPIYDDSVICIGILRKRPSKAIMVWKQIIKHIASIEKVTVTYYYSGGMTIHSAYKPIHVTIIGNGPSDKTILEKLRDYGHFGFIQMKKIIINHEFKTALKFSKVIIGEVIGTKSTIRYLNREFKILKSTVSDDKCFTLNDMDKILCTIMIDKTVFVHTE